MRKKIASPIEISKKWMLLVNKVKKKMKKITLFLYNNFLQSQLYIYKYFRTTMSLLSLGVLLLSITAFVQGQIEPWDIDITNVLDSSELDTRGKVLKNK